MSSNELKKRVNTCLNKLSDRDTVTIAANELESIAKSLSKDTFAPFLTCISSTNSSEKSPVRRQAVRILTTLSASHGEALSPHVSKMLTTIILRRLRDPEQIVRSACVESVTSIAVNIPHAPIVKLLSETLFQEQDVSSQTGACMCLCAAVDATREVDVSEVKKMAPKLVKLVRTDCFKAKAGLLSLIGSVVKGNCVKGKSLVRDVVGIGVEFLGNEDWGTRKAAAEVLEAVAVMEGGLAGEFRDVCITALENKRFDKVKVVRETMNRALEMWRDVPLMSTEELSSSSSPEDASPREHSPVLLSTSPVDFAVQTPQPSKPLSARSPPSSYSSSSNSQMSIIRNEDNNKPCISSATKLKLRRNFRSRVVPVNINDNLDIGDGDVIKENLENGNGKEFEGMSLIRNQLRQIEIQQSSLLDLLQRFIGSSQKGMSSLEKRVDGLEKVLGEMSQDLGISTRRIPDTYSEAGNMCCMIPGAEFLSPRFWKKTESQTMNPKFSSLLKNQSYKC